MFSKKIAASLVLAFGLVGSASANVVYENGTDGEFWGGNNPFTYVVVTQGFTLAQDATVTSFTYNAFTASDTQPVTNVYISFSQGANTVYSGNLAVANTAVIGGNGYYSYTDYTVNLPNVSLAAGDYVLGLKVSPTQWNEHWSIVPGGSAASDGPSHYFRLENNGPAADVPEPSSIALLALGLTGAAFARRRAKRG